MCINQPGPFEVPFESMWGISNMILVSVNARYCICISSPGVEHQQINSHVVCMLLLST